MLNRTYFIDSADPFWINHKYDDRKIIQTLHDMGAERIKSVDKYDDIFLGKVITFRTKAKNLKLYENEFNRAFGSPFSFSVKLKNW